MRSDASPGNYLNRKRLHAFNPKKKTHGSACKPDSVSAGAAPVIYLRLALLQGLS